MPWEAKNSVSMSHRRLVGLPCIYCENPLTSVDARQFIEKKLKLVRRGNRPYAVCDKCLHHALLIERACYFQQVKSIGGFENDTGLSITHVNLRCTICGTPMNSDDKNYQRLNYKPLYKVRNIWRGVCYLCITGDKA